MEWIIYGDMAVSDGRDIQTENICALLISICIVARDGRCSNLYIILVQANT